MVGLRPKPSMLCSIPVLKQSQLSFFFFFLVLFFQSQFFRKQKSGLIWTFLFFCSLKKIELIWKKKKKKKTAPEKSELFFALPNLGLEITRRDTALQKICYEQPLSPHDAIISNI